MPDDNKVITTPQERADWVKHETEDLRQARQDMEAVMATPPGRRALYRLLESSGCGLLPKSPYTDSSAGADLGAICHEIGRASIGHGLIRDMLWLAPERYREMLAEQIELHVKARRELDKKERKAPDTEDVDHAIE